MAEEIAPPSVNLANNLSMAGMFREVLGKFLMDVDDMLPAIVLSYDESKNLATVQPLIKIVDTLLRTHSRAPVASVPVFQIGAGGFVLRFPIAPGDVGWIKANDRDISLYNQSLEESPPNTYRKHTFSDGVFFPQVMRAWVINTEDAANCVLQSVDGTQRIAIWADRVKITSDNEIILDAPHASFSGGLSVAGTIRATGDIVAEDGTRNVSLNGHVHGGVMAGGSNTGAPV